ncbi:unnamed protein product [Amoebophrya sp. A120]|nr:unnamed protein product [Amoebophrya sp. A120]|eukprot:GSA120T00003174001.1
MSHYYGGGYGRGGGGGRYEGNQSSENTVTLPSLSDPFIRQAIAAPVAPSVNFAPNQHIKLGVMKYKVIFDFVSSAHDMWRTEYSAKEQGRGSEQNVAERHVRDFRSAIKGCSRKKVKSIDWNPDGTQLLYGFNDGTIRIYDAEKLELVATYGDSSSRRAANNDFCSGCFDPVFGTVTCVSETGRLVIYDPRTPPSKSASSSEPITSLHDADLTKTNSHMTNFSEVQASPCGGEYAIHTAGHRIHFLTRDFDPEIQKQNKFVLRLPYQAMDFSHAVSKVDKAEREAENAGGDGSSAKIDVGEGEMDGSALNSFTFSTDGANIYTAHQSGNIQMHKLANPRGPRQGGWHSRTKTWQAHRGPVSCVTTGGDLLATAGFDNEVRIWDATNPTQCLNSCIQGVQPVSNMSFNYDCNVLALGFGPPTGQERIRQHHLKLIGAANAGSSAQRQAEMLYEKNIVFLHPRTGEPYFHGDAANSDNPLSLPGATTCMKWNPVKNVLAFSMLESQFSDSLPDESTGSRGNSAYNSRLTPVTLKNSMCQVLRLPEVKTQDPEDDVF